MKKPSAMLGLVLVFAMGAAAAGGAQAASPSTTGPGGDEIALVNKYKEADFTVGNRAPRKIDGDWKLYSMNGSNVWVASGGYTVVQTPEHLVVRISYDKGKESDRSFELPSGRTCTVGQNGTLAWGIELEPAPDFALPVLGSDRPKTRLSDLRGKVVILDFWASWCQPCMHALPNTEALYRKYRSRGLVVLGVNIEGDTGKASRAVKSLGLSFPVLMGEPDANGDYDWSCPQIEAYRINGIPALFLVDKKGIVRLSDPRAEDIEKYLAE